jgi:hypothetical protein
MYSNGEDPPTNASRDRNIAYYCTTSASQPENTTLQLNQSPCLLSTQHERSLFISMPFHQEVGLGDEALRSFWNMPDFLSHLWETAIEIFAGIVTEAIMGKEV